MDAILDIDFIFLTRSQVMLAVITSADIHGFIILFTSPYKTILLFGSHTSRASTASISLLEDSVFSSHSITWLVVHITMQKPTTSTWIPSHELTVAKSEPSTSSG